MRTLEQELLHTPLMRRMVVGAGLIGAGLGALYAGSSNNPANDLLPTVTPSDVQARENMYSVLMCPHQDNSFTVSYEPSFEMKPGCYTQRFGE